MAGVIQPEKTPGHLLVKTSYAQSEFMCVDVLQQKKRGDKRVSSIPELGTFGLLKRAYKKVRISEKKKKGLLALFAKTKKSVVVMPQYYKTFFDNL